MQVCCLCGLGNHGARTGVTTRDQFMAACERVRRALTPHDAGTYIGSVHILRGAVTTLIKTVVPGRMNYGMRPTWATSAMLLIGRAFGVDHLLDSGYFRTLSGCVQRARTLPPAG